MTTFQDQPPQSRRALRQEQREERSRAEEIDDSAEAQRSAPSGRRARAAAPDGLVEVPASDGVPAAAADDAAPAADAAPADEATEVDAHDAGAETPVVSESAIAKSFPFAEQVEATSDDAGHPGFRLRDFSPELSTSRAESQSARDWAPAGADESVPLDYQTQGGPAFGYVSPYSEPAATAAPTPEPSFDSLFADLVVPADEAPDADTSAGDTAADTSAADIESPAAEPNDETAAPEASAPADIPVGEPIVVSEPSAPVTPVVVPPEERTLSRREWRAMRAAAEAEAAAAGETTDSDNSDADNPNADNSDADSPDAGHADATPVDGPQAASTETAQPESEVAQPTAEETPLDVLFREPETAPEASVEEAAAPEAAEPEATEPEAASTQSAEIPPLVEPSTAPHSALSDAMAEFEALTRGSNERDVAATAAPANPVFEAPAEPAAAATPAPADAPVTEAPAAQPRSPFSFLIDPNAAVAPAVTTDTGSYTPPVGHWSRQAEMDDENQPFENTLSRDVGGGNAAASTNALVLPMIPQRDDFSSVLNATGEIMVTGTINLPGSVAATGRDSRHYDDPEVDHLFDAFDNEIANTDSAPVRAITAVSSHTATRGGIESGRKQSNRMLNVLLVTASVMAVAVAGLLIAGFVFNIF